MPDTKRSLASLVTLLADNTSGAISEQDLRDMLVSMAPAMGAADMEANAGATTINTAGVYEVIAGTFVAGGSPIEVTESATGGRLTYTGTPDRHFLAVANFDMLTGSNNQVTSFQWFKNGSAIGAPLKRKVGTGTDIGAASIGTDIVMSTSDYLELKVTNDTSTATVTIQDCYIFMSGMLV